MHKILTSALSLAFAAGSGAPVLAQAIPQSQPKFLHIVREQVKIGRAADHARLEAGWPAAYEKAQSKQSYLALVAMTGARESWYVSPFESHAAWGEALARDEADGALTAELDRLSKADGDILNELRVMQARARPELSHGSYPDLSKARFFEISVFRAKAGYQDAFADAVKAYAAAVERAGAKTRWRTYEVMAGAPEATFLFFSSYESYGELDQAIADGDATGKAITSAEGAALQKLFAEGTVNVESNRYQLDPTQSYVDKATREKDPAFWMPKKAAKKPGQP